MMRALLLLFALGASSSVLPLSARPQSSVADAEHARSVWFERAELVHRAWAGADEALRAAARRRLGGPRPPDVVQLAQAWHALEGKPASVIDHPLQRFVDGLDLRVAPGVLARDATRSNRTVTVASLVRQSLKGDLTTALTWQCGELTRHGRQEPIAASHFVAPGFQMFLLDPRRADDPVSRWKLVPSFLSDGQRFVGVPVPVPAALEGGPPQDPLLAAAVARWVATGTRSFGSLEALGGNVVPLTAPSGSFGWRRAATGARRATVLVLQHALEPATGPLTGWLGLRWKELAETGVELLVVPNDMRERPEFVQLVAERRAQAPVFVVLRGDAIAHWLLAATRAPLAVDGVVLASGSIAPSAALAGDAPLLWIGANARDLAKIRVTGIVGDTSEFLDEPLLPGRIGPWLNAQLAAR